MPTTKYSDYLAMLKLIQAAFPNRMNNGRHRVALYRTAFNIYQRRDK